MSALELIEAVEQAGGSLQVSGDRLRYSIPREAAHLVPALRIHKPAVITILRQRRQTFTCRKCGAHFDTRIGLAKHDAYGCGDERRAEPTVQTLPRCRACGSYALYRERPGMLKCETCHVRQ